ncbi:MAG: radical SAM protein [Candidatus Lokiarchaeota archaeon]|nr:radical SAM protein [Candidatus Lokiarchaeota archaeon]MBD3200802.1 radical SAM protein [Candidatus Lokiarchaeota archaeon]
MFIKKHNDRSNPPIDLFLRKDIVTSMNKGNFVSVAVEINERCAGGCLYCYASSAEDESLRADNISLEKLKEILELKKLGLKVVHFYGGDQLIHPQIKKMLFYTINEGFDILLPLAGLIPESKVDWLVEAQNLARSKKQEFLIGIHIDSLDQEIYNKTNAYPKSLQSKIESYQALLDAGFPSDKIYGCTTLTKQTGEKMIELLDWFYSKGTKHVAINTFKPLGLSRDQGAKWEPTLAQIEKVFRHLGKIEGKHMLMVGNTDGKYACQSHIAITTNGNVVPCLFLRDFSEGNIFEENIVDIVKKGKKKLKLDIKVKGKCASCISKMVCYGCRASAYLYAGDISASDPKCFFNPDAPERCF